MGMQDTNIRLRVTGNSCGATRLCSDGTGTGNGCVGLMVCIAELIQTAEGGGCNRTHRGLFIAGMRSANCDQGETDLPGNNSHLSPFVHQPSRISGGRLMCERVTRCMEFNVRW
jgi:hypothetical protein